MTEGVACPVCGSHFAAIGPGGPSAEDGGAGHGPGGVAAAPDDQGRGSLAEHLVERAARSDASHIMWMNRHVTKLQTSASQLSPLLEAVLAGQTTDGTRVSR